MALIDEKDLLRKVNVKQDEGTGGKRATTTKPGLPPIPESGTVTAGPVADAVITQPVEKAPEYTAEAAEPVVSDAPAAPAVEDYSRYLEQMHRAKQDAAVAGLEAAYKQNMASLDRSKETVAEQHQAARNQTAGASEQAKRNFAQYAAASGLNSGTGGQAELARSVGLQNSLGAINAQEANAMADLELQRAQIDAEYNTAIAQAQAEGSYELAEALYQEKIRVQEAAQELQRYQDSMAQQEYENRIARQKYADSLAADQKETLAGYGLTYLKAGIMPTAEMLNAMGISAEDAQSYIGASVEEKPGGGLGLQAARQAATLGYFDENVLAVLRANGYTDGLLYNLYGYDTQPYHPDYFRQTMAQVASALKHGNTDSAKVGLDLIWDKLNYEQKSQARELLARYEYHYQE